jgi:hypothetical protein
VRTSVAELLVGAGLGVGIFVAQEAWPSLPTAVLLPLALLAVVSFVAGVIGLVRQRQPTLREPLIKAGDGGPGGDIYPGGIGVAGGGGPGGGIGIDVEGLTRGALASGGTASVNPGALEFNHLRSVIGKYADDNTNAEITYHVPEMEQLANRLASVFESASWPVVCNKRPQPMADDQGGVEVSGHNDNLVAEVAAALAMSGVPFVSQRIEKTELAAGAAGYPRVTHKVTLRLG